MSPCFAESAKSQISWILKNTNHQLYFISRQTDNWQQWMIKNFAMYNVHFESDKYYYLTCPNEEDQSCWQKILYIGNKDLLDKWKRHQ
jgi:hypothetical protein